MRAFPLPSLPYSKSTCCYSLPPVGHKIPPSLVIRMLAGKGQDLEGDLLAPLREHLGAANITFLPSGRAALWLILEVLSHRNPEKKEVIVPAYTCPAVVSAVLRAGLKPVLCDINLRDFGYSLDNLADKISRRTLAVVVVHLFGYSVEMNALLQWGRQQGFYVIEDAAQAFGNVTLDDSGKKLGLSGDAGFFSFGRGKPLSVLHGGLLVAQSDDLHRELQRLYAGLPSSPTFVKLKFPFLVAAYNLLLKPRLYWIPQRMPFLHLGETLFEEGFRISKGLEMAMSLIQGLLKSVDNHKRVKGVNSRHYSGELCPLPGVVPPPRLDYPYLRYPLRLESKDLRDNLLKKLASEGTGSALLYPCPLNELDRLRDILDDRAHYSNAATLSKTLITLPVHEGLTSDMKDRILWLVSEGLRK